MHINSLQTYLEIKPALSGRRLKIFNYIQIHGECTDRQIKNGLGLPDMNSVRPRCTELVHEGVLEEKRTIKDTMTNRPCRVLGLPSKPATQMSLI